MSLKIVEGKSKDAEVKLKIIEGILKTAKGNTKTSRWKMNIPERKQHINAIVLIISQAEN